MLELERRKREDILDISERVRHWELKCSMNYYTHETRIKIPKLVM